MNEVIDHLAVLTGLRDRDTLDSSLVSVIRDLLQPRCVSIHRLVGEPGAGRWLTRARLAAGDTVAATDSSWDELDHLPPADDFPERFRCLQTAQAQTTAAADGTNTTWLPLPSDAGVVGVVEIESDGPLDPVLQRLAQGVLRIYRNVHGLLDYSERDMLTGLLNRKSFDENFYKVSAMPLTLEAETPAERRHGQAPRFWLCMLDIDHFKSVNDQHGHLIGDEVLLLLSRIMRTCFRYYDQLYRYGGEEFVVLLRCADETDASAALNRFREMVQAYAFPRVGTCTISIGYTDIRSGDTPSAAFERADRAIYYAKQNGRNRVCSYSGLIEQGLIVDEHASGDVELF